MFNRNGELIRSKYKEYLVPTLFMTVALYLASVVDGIIVSWLIGSDGLAAVNLNAPVVYIINTIFTIFIVGSTTLISIAKGQRKEKEVNKIFTVTLIAGVTIDCLLVILGYLFLEPLSNMLAQGGSLQSLTMAYLWPLLVCAPFIFISLGLANYVRVDGYPKLAAAVSVVSNVVNLVCDIVFINVFHMGIAGAGWATITGYIVGFLILIPYFLSKSRKLRFVKITLPDFGRLKEIMTTGFPGALSQGLAFVRTLALNMIILTTFGSEGMAVFAVCLNTMNFALMFIRGASDTMLPIGGFLFGDGDSKGLRYLIKIALGVALCTSIVLVIIFEFFPQSVAIIFNLSTSIDLFKQALQVYALSIPLFAINYLFLCFYQTTKRKSIATAISVLEGFVIIVGVAFIFAKNSPGLFWFAFPIAELSTIVIMGAYIYYLSQKKALGFPLLLQCDTKVQAEFDTSIKNDIKKSVQLSEEVEHFCIEQGIDAKRAQFAAIVTEEMAVNVSKYAYNQGKLKMIDVCVSVSTQKEMTLRFRDDGVPFDPLIYSEKEKDVFEFGGIDMVQAVAKQMDYARVLGFNITVITL